MEPTSSFLLPGDVRAVRPGVVMGVAARQSSEWASGEAKYDFPNGGTEASSSVRALIFSATRQMVI